mgnify:CR=1 FL=1
MKALGAKIINTPSDQGIKAPLKKQKRFTIKLLTVSFQCNSKIRPTLILIITLWHKSCLTTSMTQLTPFVAGAGSGGTFAGVARYLKEHNPATQTIVVEPEGSILNGGPAHPHRTEGIGVEFVPPFFLKMFNRQNVNNCRCDAFHQVKELAKKQGLFIGRFKRGCFGCQLKGCQGTSRE